MKQLSTLILIASAMLLGACSQIDTGNVGVERTLGKVSTEALPPGVYFTLFKTVDEFTGKEVLFQLDDFQVWKITGELQHVFRPCAAPGINRLVVVTDHRQAAVTAGQQPHQFIL